MNFTISVDCALVQFLYSFGYAPLPQTLLSGDHSDKKNDALISESIAKVRQYF